MCHPTKHNTIYTYIHPYYNTIQTDCQAKQSQRYAEIGADRAVTICIFEVDMVGYVCGYFIFILMSLATLTNVTRLSPELPCLVAPRIFILAVDGK